MDHFMEIAKMRAARMLWAKIVNQVWPQESAIAYAQNPLSDFGMEPYRTGSV